jgi:hypothetical protein
MQMVTTTIEDLHVDVLQHLDSLSLVEVSCATRALVIDLETWCTLCLTESHDEIFFFCSTNVC